LTNSERINRISCVLKLQFRVFQRRPHLLSFTNPDTLQPLPNWVSALLLFPASRDCWGRITAKKKAAESDLPGVVFSAPVFNRQFRIR